MKKLMIIATTIGCVMATTAMADLSSYCPNPNDPQAIKKVGGQFIGYAPGPTTFAQEFGFNNHKHIGAFNSAADYLPSYNNPYGQIACNYANGTLWLVKPSVNATTTGSNWLSAGNTSQCFNSDSLACTFTVTQ